MHKVVYTPRSTPDLHTQKRWAAMVAAERAAQLDELASLREHELAIVARCGDGGVRSLALAAWHCRRQIQVEVVA